MTNTYRIRNVAVGTVKKSIQAIQSGFFGSGLISCYVKTFHTPIDIKKQLINRGMIVIVNNRADKFGSILLKLSL